MAEVQNEIERIFELAKVNILLIESVETEQYKCKEHIDLRI